MELTYADIIGAADAFGRLANQRMDINLDTAIAFEENKRALIRVIRVHNAVNAQLIRKFGQPPDKKDPEKNKWHIPEEDIEHLTEYWAEYDELMCKTAEINIHLLHEEDIEKLKKSMTIADQGALFFLLQTSQEDAE